MSAHAKLLAEIFDEKTVRVLQYLLQKEDVFYLRDLSRESGISLATTHRIIQRLLKLGLVTKITQNKMVYYQLIKSTPVFRELYRIVIGTTADPVDLLRNKLKKEYSGEAAVYVGQKGKLFIISNEVKQDFLRITYEEVEKETGYKIRALLLSPGQFRQMKDMGLLK